MIASSYRFERQLDARRVTAMAATIAAHIAAVALVALPTGIPAMRPQQLVVEAVIREIQKLPVVPPPPEPLPPPRVPHPTVRTPVQHIPQPAPAPTPTNIPAVVEVSVPVAPPSAAAAPAGSTDGVAEGVGGGETRTLAYEGAFKLRYPIAALRKREHGVVLLRVLVDASGSAERVQIERSSGHPALDSAAIDSVKQARFKPVLRDGTPIPGWGLVPIEFRLDRA